MSEVVGLPQYSEAFMHAHHMHGLTMLTMLHGLTFVTLRDDLGVMSWGHRCRILGHRDTWLGAAISAIVPPPGAGSAAKTSTLEEEDKEGDEEWHELVFNIGDVGGDGHDKTTSVRLLCNAAAAEVEEAYGRACTALGFSLHGRAGWFTEFEDFNLTDGRFEQLTAAGFSPALLFGLPAGTPVSPEDVAMPMQVEPEMLVALVVWMAATQRPGFLNTLKGSCVYFKRTN